MFFSISVKVIDSVSALIHPISLTRPVFQDGCCIFFYPGLTADVYTWVVQRSKGWRRGPWGGGWGRKRRMDERMTRVSHQAQWARSPARGLMATSVGWALVELPKGIGGGHYVRGWVWRFGRGGEVKGWPSGGEAEELSDCLDNMHTCTYKHTHCHTDWRSCGPVSRTFIPDRLFQ